VDGRVSSLAHEIMLLGTAAADPGHSWSGLPGQPPARRLNSR
jgi:hypothetical protein